MRLFLPAFCYGSAVNVDLYFSWSVWAWGPGWEADDMRNYFPALRCEVPLNTLCYFLLFLSFFFLLGTLFSPQSPVSHNVFNVFASNVTSKGRHQTKESKIRQMFHYFTFVSRNTLLISYILCLVHEQCTCY
jgi:hypothetical protein